MMEAFDCMWTVAGWMLRLLVMYTHSPGSGVSGHTGGSPVFLNTRPCQQLLPNRHGSPGSAQESVLYLFQSLWIHQDASGLDISSCHFPMVDASHDVRFHVSVPLGLSGWPSHLLKDIWWTLGIPRTNLATCDWDRAQVETEQVPVSEAPGHVPWTYHICGGRELWSWRK